MGIEFASRDQLIQAIDVAIHQGDAVATMHALRGALCHAIKSGAVQMPACVFEACPDHYARRELYRSLEHGYSVVAMTWGARQGTPIHDHAGMWCVEGVWQGELEVVQYELLERADPRWRFRAVGSIQASAGSAGSLIPPHEHHSICNASATDIAVSVHVYQRPMTGCNVFEPESGEWYTRHPHALQLDAAGNA